jgi:hypothetical protein
MLNIVGDQVELTYSTDEKSQYTRVGGNREEPRGPSVAALLRDDTHQSGRGALFIAPRAPQSLSSRGVVKQQRGISRKEYDVN